MGASFLGRGGEGKEAHLAVSDDAAGEFKALINLMKDPTDNKEEIAEGADLDSEDDDLLR